jgi:hypothetical protein
MTTDTSPDENVQILQSLWEPHPGQRAVMNLDVRFRVVAAGRRWGKSVMAAHEALTFALEHTDATVWWVSPSYDQSNNFGFDKIKPLVSPDVLVDVKRTKPRVLEFKNGSSISFRSAEREDSLRGPGIDFLIVDEAGSVPERAWSEELRPALSDTRGEALIVGTPRGRNWYFEWYQRGQSDDHRDTASLRVETAQNPYVDDDEIASLRDQMPERVFRQEHLAEFVDDSGGVFDNVRESVGEHTLPIPPSSSASPFAIGVDFARHEDYTAIVVLDGDGRLVAFDRLRRVSWNRIESRVTDLAEKYDRSTVAVDATRDNKIVSDLENSRLDVEPVNFSSKKTELIDNLALSLESGELTLSSDAPELINELEVFEYDMTDSGRVRYAAPSGFHDDTVDALALAVEAKTNVSTGEIGAASLDLGTIDTLEERGRSGRGRR